MKIILLAGFTTLLFIAGCESDAPPPKESEGEPSQSTEHLYSKEQALMEQAQGVESLLKNDADQKKKAVSLELNGE